VEFSNLLFVASVNMSVHAELVEVSDDEEDDGFEVDVSWMEKELPLSFVYSYFSLNFRSRR